MTVERRNRLLALSVVVVTLYILSAEVCPRFQSTIREYTAARARETNVLTKEEFLIRKKALEAESLWLDRVRKTKYIGEGREEGVLFGYLDTLAKRSDIVVSSFAPVQAKSRLDASEHSYVIGFTSTFHRTAAYINAVEIGAFPMKVSALSIASDPPGDSRLRVTITWNTLLMSGPR